MGISLKRLNGWEPTTFYTLDADGRTVSSWLEPEWDDTEREWARSWREYKASLLCRLCGMPKEVCRSVDTDGRVIATFERCHVAAAIASKQKNFDGSFPETLEFTARVVG